MIKNTKSWDMINRPLPPSFTPSGFFGQSSDMIIKIPNIALPEEIDIILNAAQDENIWDMSLDGVWKGRVSGQDILFNNYNEAFFTILEIQDRFRIEVEKFYKVEAVQTSAKIVRWNVGDYQPPHADKESPDGLIKTYDGQYDIGSIVYLNNNYSGGELYFPQHNLEFKPEVRSAYAFPGDKNYLHGVREITEGVRYTLPIFWTITKYL